LAKASATDFDTEWVGVMSLVDIDGLTEETTPGSTDLVLVELAAGGLRKVQIDNLPGGEGGGLASVADDTTPQLGGDLDYNGNQVVDANGNEVLGFASVASAVNFVQLTNAATTDGAIVEAEGGDTDVDLVLRGKGSGAVSVEGDLAVSGTVDGRDVADDGTKLDGIESGADVTDATNVNAAGAVMESDFNAQTILAATTDNTPVAVTVGESEIVGRASGGNVDALTATQVRTIINVENGADVTDATNVNAAGAVMESDFNAQTVLAATADNTPAAVTVGEGEIVGRASGGNVDALTATQVRTIINVADGAEVNPAPPSQANAEDGTNTTEYTFTPQRVHQAAKDAVPFSLIVAVGDETTALTTGTGKVTFRLPHAVTLTAVRASLTTESSSGAVTVDINEGGSTILSTKLTIDANEKTSMTAATAAVISDTTLADDAEMTIDIDGAGTGAAGLKVTLIGYKTTT
jgi:hypothetical protein